MQSTLEAVLRDKERELKLYHRFESLVRFCETEVFPLTRVPLQRHIEELKVFIEKLFPDPLDRREEMFSGEVFVLLCTLYFHDMGVVTSYGWSASRDILDSMESPPKTLFLNSEIGRRLGIPEKAMELVNSLVFSVRKIPLEWEIREDARKAIVRNGRMLGEIFNFAHLMWDIFSPYAGHTVLRRLQDPDLRLLFGEASVEVDSRAGVITVRCRPEVPYQSHVLRRTRAYVDSMFKRFMETVNGRLGFQYRQIVWDVGESEDSLHTQPVPGLRPFTPFKGEPFARWEEASHLLDKLFHYGHVIVVGDGASGKTTLVDSFVVPQLRRMSPNVFYSEIWDQPVQQIREAIEREGATPPGLAVDIVSTFRRLLKDGRCFLILDGCERLKTVAHDEREKLERLVDFCVENENMYLVALGDKEAFFDWYRPFRMTSLSAVYELGHVIQVEARLLSAVGEPAPIEKVDEGLDALVATAAGDGALIAVVGVLAGETGGQMRRYTKRDIFIDTCLPEQEIGSVLERLQAAGAVRRQDALDSEFYALAGRHVRVRLSERLDLSEALEKRKIREMLKDASAAGRLLAAEDLDRIERVSDGMVFTSKEMGLIVASAVSDGRDCTRLLDKAEQQLVGFEIDPVLALLSSPDPHLRERAIKALSRVKDEGIINPILAHLRKEEDPDLRRLLVDIFVAIGKRRAIVALVKTLTEIRDGAAKARAIERIYELPARRARELLIRIADIEKDPEIIDRIDGLLRQLEE